MRRIDAEKLFEKLGNIKPKNKQQYEDIGMFMEMVTNSPTIEEGPHGEWKIFINKIGDVCVRCSVCGVVFDFSSNYCHCCGAKMGGDSE